MMRVKQTPVQGRKKKEKERMNLCLTKRSKCQEEWEEQISLWSILFTSPRQLNYTNRKTEVVSGAGVPTTLCGIAPKILANLHGKQI